MKYELTNPCGNCPFRSDIRAFLNPARAREIARSLDRGEFPCHKTTVPGSGDNGDEDLVGTEDSQHCAGALILLEKMERPSQMMRICERLGFYDRTKLNLDAPVFDSLVEWIDAQPERGARMSNELSKPSRKPTLAGCEAMIQGAIDAAKEHFAVIGAQLALIRDHVLYSEDTFEEYVAARWDFTKSYAYRLIQAAGVVANLEDEDVDEGPATERQARALADASDDPETQAEVWTTAQEVAQDQQPTADQIETAAEIVETGSPVNHESIEIDDAIAAFLKIQKKMMKAGQRIQSGIIAKAAVSSPFQNRKVKFFKLVDNLAAQVDLVREHIEGLDKSWTATKKQVDE